MKSRSFHHLGELLVSLGLLALGAYVLVQTRNIAETQGYEQLGPRLFPTLIGAGLLVFGATLGWQSLTGGWRDVPMDQERHDDPDRLAFGLISTAVILHMTLIGWIGFVFASTGLFALIARAFGSRRWLRDVTVGALLALVAFYLFTLALRLNLTKSPLGVI